MALTFISGTDDYLVQHKAAHQWEQIAKQFDDPEALERVDGQAGNVDEVSKAVTQFVSSVQTISMFSPRKAVWFRSVNFLADSVTGRAAGTAEAVDRMMHCLQHFDHESVSVLVSASPIDRRKKPYKWLNEHGKGVFIDASKDSGALVKLVEEEVAALGAGFRGNAARVLIDIVAGDTRLALEESRKMAAYASSEKGIITSDMVTALVPPVADSDFFEAAEAFFELNLDKTLEAIRRHFFAGHDARPLITTLQNRNRLMIQLKALMAGGKIRGRVSDAALASASSHYPWFGSSSAKTPYNVFSQNPWYLSRLAGPLDRLSLRNLLDFQEAFRDAFMQIISRPHEQEAVMRAAAIHCLSCIRS